MKPDLPPFALLWMTTMFPGVAIDCPLSLKMGSGFGGGLL